MYRPSPRFLVVAYVAIVVGAAVFAFAQLRRERPPIEIRSYSAVDADVDTTAEFMSVPSCDCGGGSMPLERGIHRWRIEGTLRDGRRDGKWQWTYSNIPQLAKVGYYVDGVKVGLWSWWFRDGKRRMQGAFTRGQRKGIWQSWYPTERFEQLLTYVNGEVEGTGLLWWPNGELRWAFEMRHGRLEGKFLQWFEPGGFDAGGSYVYADGKRVRSFEESELGK